MMNDQHIRSADRWAAERDAYAEDVASQARNDAYHEARRQRVSDAHAAVIAARAYRDTLQRSYREWDAEWTAQHARAAK